MLVLLADQQSSHRSAPRMLCRAQPGVDVLGEASEMTGLLFAVDSTRPDVVVLDSHAVQAKLGLLWDLLHPLDDPPSIVGMSGREQSRKPGTKRAGNRPPQAPTDFERRFHA
jgi:DNA-binding NarL/FixJ family response regulator